MTYKQIIFSLLTIFFFSSCETEKEPEKTYGIAGPQTSQVYTNVDDPYTSIIYPSNLSSMDKKSPVVFFISGWFGNPRPYTTYKSVIEFIVSHGYTVVYADEGSTTNPMHSINAMEKILQNNSIQSSIIDHLDLNKIGVLGSSAGGGITFTVLDYFVDKNYGSEGRFIMAFDPWFAFDMNENDMKNLPSNTNVVIIKFGPKGNNDLSGTDARIPLTEYYLLESIPDKQKDYQIYENADHSYPKGDQAYEHKQGILKPLDALLEYTFVKQTEATRIIALENGNDDPYANGNGIQEILNTYEYPCNGANTLIDYCKIAP